MPQLPDYAQFANVKLIEELYGRYQADPMSVESSWRHFFEGMNFASSFSPPAASDSSAIRIHALIQAYRRYGHLAAQFNPLGPSERVVPELGLEKLGFSTGELDQFFPTLGLGEKKEATLSEIVQTLEKIYCQKIGFEYMDLGHSELERWMQKQLESSERAALTLEEKHLLLEFLSRSEVFETFLHTKYVGQTRFSLEGAETMIPLLVEVMERGRALGLEEAWIGMAHRGRLNVLTHLLNKPLSSILEEFEDDTNLSFAGNDDVRYHMGFVGEWKSRSGQTMKIGMAANPSHLESVDPVVLGQVFAKQLARGKKTILPLLIHGDASVAGQGVVYETLQLMNLPNYSVGGTFHLVVNNQIGYTTLPDEGRSTRYCTDIAKSFGCPVFHVNAEDPESCLLAAKLAIEIRQTFQIDVFIDLLCYRKYGHNEGDEPSYTQPLQYAQIRAKKTIRQLYYEQLMAAGYVEQKMAESKEAEFKQALQNALTKAQEKTAPKPEVKPPSLLAPFSAPASAASLQEVLDQFCEIPAGFHLHPKLQKWVKERSCSLKGAIDWSTAECLAFGSLLIGGKKVRLAGQDSQRGTFSQRHMVWIDVETGAPHIPWKGSFQIVNSPLTEYAGLGFEYGYSCAAPETLALWEAQYGDFDNGAQIIIDQYLVSAEQKWNTPSSLVLLLPHGYEGAGPEHSSARLERFLQLAAHQNVQIVNPTTPAQYFHLLRRQALRNVRKPLIIFTPKSLLRSPACTSTIEAFTEGNFEEILDDPNPPQTCKRLLLCSGKVFYDLLSLRRRTDAAIIRIEQLYPLHEEKLQKFLSKYPGERFWVQEEPQNMGAWNFIRPFLPQTTYVGRPENATTATGSHLKHKQEQTALLEKAFL